MAGVANAACVDPVGAKIFALYPLPNTNLAQNGQLGAFSGNNYIASPTESRNSDQFGTRVDYKISDKDSIYGHDVVFDLRQNIPEFSLRSIPSPTVRLAQHRITMTVARTSPWHGSIHSTLF